MTAGGGLPAGWGLLADAGTRRTDGGRVLVGGNPFRILRLTDAGARLVDRLLAGDPLPRSSAARRLARRLVDAGMAHPRPAPSDDAPAPLPADVAVVIPVRDRAADLAATLTTLGPVGEVLVVDDGSADPAAVQAAAAPGPTTRILRHDRPAGPGAARNTGWRAATRPVIAFVDADVEATPGWLDLLLAHLGDGAIAGVAPRIRSLDGAAPPWLAAYEAVRSSLDLGPAPGAVRPGSRIAYVPTAALVVRREALDAVAGFDEALAYGEDVDLVWRIAALGDGAGGGAIRYEPAATVGHPSRPSLREWLTQRYRYGTAAADLAERHGDAVSPLGVSGWSALAWAAVVAAHPVAGAAVAAGTTAALVPKFESLDHPAREAIRVAGRGHLWAGRSVADALRRPWWPLALLLGATVRRSRPALVAALVVPAVLDHRRDRPALGLVPFATLRLLDDLAYGTGVWAGCLRRRSIRALRPAFTGRIPPPAATAGDGASGGADLDRSVR